MLGALFAWRPHLSTFPEFTSWATESHLVIIASEWKCINSITKLFWLLLAWVIEKYFCVKYMHATYVCVCKCEHFMVYVYGNQRTSFIVGSHLLPHLRHISLFFIITYTKRDDPWALEYWRCVLLHHGFWKSELSSHTGMASALSTESSVFPHSLALNISRTFT